MFCIYCGKEIADDSKFCPSCGEKLEPANEENCEQSSEPLQKDTVQMGEKSEVEKQANIPPVEAKKAKGKKKAPALIAVLMAVVVAIVAFIGLNPKQVELSELIGQPINVWENTLGVELEQFEDGVYYYNKGNAKYFECAVDETGAVTRVALLNTDKERFCLFGVANGTGAKDAQEFLSEAGLTNVCDNLWQCPNEVDAVFLSNGTWFYEKDSVVLQNELLRIHAEEAFVYQYSDSVGAIYIGDGKILEYCHDSFAEFTYLFKETTDYNKTDLVGRYDGRYIKVEGTVIDVFADGRISVLCQDDEASTAAGLLWPMQGFADITLVESQSPEISRVKKDSHVVIYGQLDMYNYDLLLGGFDLYNGVLISVDGEIISTPEIDYMIPGITEYSENEDDTDVPDVPDLPLESLNLPAWCSGNYYGEDLYSEITFGGKTGPLDISIYRLAAIEDCVITEQSENHISFTGKFDVDVGSVSGTLTNYGGNDVTLTITESDWSYFPSGTMMEFYYDYKDPNYLSNKNNSSEYGMTGVYASTEIAANRIFVWEADGMVCLSMTNRGESIDLLELAEWDIERNNDIIYFSSYTLSGEEVSGSYDPVTETLELWPVESDSMLMSYGLSGFFLKQVD